MKTIPILSFVILLCITVGCVETRTVKFQPAALPATPVEQKVPLSAALVLDRDFKDYGIKAQLVGGSAIYPIGSQLTSYAGDVSRNVFQQVAVFDSPEAAIGKADVILIPQAVRSSTHLGNPITVLVAVEWLVKDRRGDASPMAHDSGVGYFGSTRCVWL